MVIINEKNFARHVSFLRTIRDAAWYNDLQTPTHRTATRESYPVHRRLVHHLADSLSFF
jgi:hypothetical protein